MGSSWSKSLGKPHMFRRPFPAIGGHTAPTSPSRTPATTLVRSVEVMTRVWRHDENASLVLKAASNPATITTPVWAGRAGLYRDR